MSRYMTKKQLLQEFYLCGKDPSYFIDNYCKIPDPNDAGIIPFKTYNYQKDLLVDFMDFKRNIVVKSRQLGISTIVAGYSAWLMLFHRNKKINVISIDFDTAKEIVLKVKFIIKNLPDFFRRIKKMQIELDNRTSVQLKNGSLIKALASKDTAGRSAALSLLILDEAAHIDGIDELWASAKPTVDAGGNVIALSCVTKDTFVFTDKGLQQIEDFIFPENIGGYCVEPYQVLGRDKLRKGMLFHNNGKVKTRKIITKYSMLEASENHKLWAFKDGKFGWFRTDELSVNDSISIQYGLNKWGSNDDVSSFKPKITSNHKNIFSMKKITPDFAYILGMFLAEGSSYFPKNQNGERVGCSLTFTCGDPIKTALEKIGFHVSCYDQLHYTISSKTLGDFLEYLGFDLSLKAKNKVIPKRLLQMSRENIIALLQGLFDGDGCSRKDRGAVCIGLSTLKMISQIRMLLLNFGILSEYRKTITKPTQKVKVFSEQHRLDLNAANSKKFYDLIGFRFQRKQKNEEVLNSRNLSRNSSKDIIPGFISIMNELFSYYPKGSEYLRLNEGISVSSIVNKTTKCTNEVSRGTVLKMFNLVKDKLPIAYKEEIEKNLQENLVWCKIKEIQESENETYDFSLPENKNDFWDHSVLYNGMLGHQTPYGVGNWFHTIWEGSQNEVRNNGWKGTELNWDVHPNRDEQWLEDQRLEFSDRFIAQEYECFSGNTRVATSNGYKRIENIQVGDLVLTHKGRFREVQYVNEKSASDVYEFNTYLNREKRFVTGNHPILRENRMWAPFKECEAQNHSLFSAQPTKIDFHEYQGDLDLFSILDDGFFKLDLLKEDVVYLNDRRHKIPHKRFIKVDYDLGRMIGLFLAEGNVNNTTVQFSFNYSEEKETWVKELINIIKDKFGLENAKMAHEGDAGSVWFNSFILSRFIKKICDGSKAPQKRLTNFAYECSNREFLRGVLDGVFEGDGCILEKYAKTLNITSKELIYDVKYICMLLGLGFSSIRKSKDKHRGIIEGRIVSCNEQYVLKMLRTKHLKISKLSDLVHLSLEQNSPVYDGMYNANEEYFLTKLLLKERKTEHCKVYNLQVEEDESYVTEHFVVHNCSFLASGETVIGGQLLKKIKDGCKEPKIKIGFDRGLWIWEKYVPGETYFITGDTARGDAQDFSAFHVWKSATMEQVAEYHGQCDIDTFANLLYDTGTDYGNALIAVENAGLGHEVSMKLFKAEYKNVYFSKKGTHEHVPQFEAYGRKDCVPGVTISGGVRNTGTRPLIIGKLEEYTRVGLIRINSLRLATELTYFIWHNGRPEAMKGKNDDLTMSAAIGCWIRDTILVVDRADVEFKKTVLKTMKRQNTMLNTAIPGMMSYNKNHSLDIMRKQQVKERQKFNWLLRG